MKASSEQFSNSFVLCFQAFRDKKFRDKVVKSIVDTMLSGRISVERAIIVVKVKKYLSFIQKV